MAVTSYRTNVWNNPDGLMTLFGNDKSIASRGGEASVAIGGRHIVEVEIDLTTLATSGQKIVADNVFIPNGAFIEAVIVMATVAATSSGNGTIDIGLVDQDRTTQIDFDGLVAAMVKGSVDLLGEYNTLNAGSTYAGALVGTKITNTGVITANVNTAVYQTGKILVRIMYSTPLAADL